MTITWTKEKLKAFKKTLDAQSNGVEEDSRPCEVFTFEGNKFLPSYAKYLIEYLEGQFGV